MRLPWVQVSNELIEQAADIAVVLGEDQFRMLGGLVRMVQWALLRCPENAPPSANAVVKGPSAALLIARAAGFQGDPEQFVTALVECQPDPLLERVEGGVRVRGLKRYDATWGRSNPDPWAEWKQTHPDLFPETKRKRGESDAEPTQTRSKVASPDQDPDPDPDLDHHHQPPPAGKKRSRSSAPTADEADTTTTDLDQVADGELPETPAGFWEWIRRCRRANGLPQELRAPKGFSGWHGEALAATDTDGLCEAYRRFAGDAHFASRSWPTAIFITEGVWKCRAPQRRAQ